MRIRPLNRRAQKSAAALRELQGNPSFHCAVSSENEPELGGEIPSVIEGFALADGNNPRHRDQRANAGNGLGIGANLHRWRSTVWQ